MGECGAEGGSFLSAATQPKIKKKYQKAATISLKIVVIPISAQIRLIIVYIEYVFQKSTENHS